jgi:NitT/TauT family transport system substrate-binding protein
MTINRRKLLKTAAASAVLSSVFTPFVHAQTLKRARFAPAIKNLTSAFTNVLAGEVLGYAKQRGIHIEGVGLNSSPAIFAGLMQGELEFGAVAPSIAIPLFAKGEMPPIVSFYEYTYPYKWDVAVKEESPIKTYADLKGKKIGTSNLGTTDYTVTRAVLKNINIDPDRDVTWTAVGEGATAGAALERNAIDALAYFDTGFAVIENAGIKFRMLPRPDTVPLIGGFFIGATRDFLKNNRDVCVAFGQCVAMTTVYTLANPKAGAKAFLEMFPGSAPRNVPSEQAIEITQNAMRRRMKLWEPPYPNTKLGFIRDDEWKREAEFIGASVADLTPLYTNELIEDIHKFDSEAVIAQAKAAKS